MKTKMKRALSMVLALCMCMTMMPMMVSAAGKGAQTGAISVVSAEGKPGEEVQVAIRIDSNPGIVAAKLTVAYDAKVLTLTKSEDCGILGEHVFSETLDVNPYVLVWVNGLSTTNFTQTGDLVRLTFKIADDAKPGDYALTLTSDPDSLCDKDLNNVPFTLTQGKVTVASESKPVINSHPENKTAAEGETVQFKVGAEGKNLKYQWQLSYAGSKDWQNVPASFEGGKTSTLSVKATMGRNEYRFRCVVTDGSGNKVISNPATLTVKSAQTALYVKSLTASKTTVNSGEKITVTAQGAGGSGNYLYKFIINDTSNNSWYKLQDYSKNNTITWKATTAGTKRIMVDIKDSEGHMVGKNIPIKVNGSVQTPLSVELKASTTTASSGDTVTFTAVAKGGSGKYSFKFIINDTTDNKWYRLQDYGKNNVITWKATTAGKKRIMVDVMDSTGKRVGHNVAVIVG